MLFAWSAVMLYFYVSGRVDHFLTESFRIGPLIGGLGLAVVGFFNLFTSRAQVACGHDHIHHGDHDHEHTDECEHDHKHSHECERDHHHGHGHGHDHRHGHGHDHEHAGHTHDDQTIPGVIATLVIVLIPAIGAAALSQDSFSVETLANKGLYSNEAATPPPPKETTGADSDRYTLADLEKQVRKSPEGNFLIPIPSLFYSAADEELADILLGQPVETTGQVAPEIAENDPDGTRLRFYRLFVSCCLADARPIGFSAEFGKRPPLLAEDSWVKIVGTMTYPEKDGRRVPILQVDNFEVIPKPQDVMY
jgi:uncharacterized repeat protein (TIGR03943 family)